MAEKKTTKASPVTKAAGPGIGSLMGIAYMLDKYIPEAIRDYNDKLTNRRFIGLKYGVICHAHRWCADFIGSCDGLILAGLALPEWFKDDRECQEVKLWNRSVEIYRDTFDPKSCSVEISARYTDDEIARIV